jgi:hypothetical protein
MFTTSPAFFSSIKSSYYNGFQFIWNHVADFTVQYQKYTYYPIMMVARFNLYSKIHQTRHSRLDSTYRGPRLSLLHLPLLLPSLVEEHPQRKGCLAFLVGEPHGHFASANPDHIVSLGRKHV